MRNEPYFHVGYTHKINFSSTHNINIKHNKKCVYTKRLPKNDSGKKIRSNFLWKFSFLKFYVMGATEIDFGGIAHVKVWVIAHQKI